MSAMCTLHAPRDVKVLRTLDTTPRHSLRSQHQKEKMFLASLYLRGGDFFLKWKGHFSFWCSALQSRAGVGAKRIPSRHSVRYTRLSVTTVCLRFRCSVPPSLPPPMLDLFCAVWIFGFLVWVEELGLGRDINITTYCLTERSRAMILIYDTRF
jgi:hypothetical protein